MSTDIHRNQKKGHWHFDIQQPKLIYLLTSKSYEAYQERRKSNMNLILASCSQFIVERSLSALATAEMIRGRRAILSRHHISANFPRLKSSEWSAVPSSDCPSFVTSTRNKSLKKKRIRFKLWLTNLSTPLLWKN